MATIFQSLPAELTEVDVILVGGRFSPPFVMVNLKVL
jgi:hypothetical protein